MLTLEKLITNRIARELVIRGGYLDSAKFQRTQIKPIEDYLHEILPYNDSQRWRQAMSFYSAFRSLTREHKIPIKFLRDNIGIIARNFVWEKQNNRAYTIVGHIPEESRYVFQNSVEEDSILLYTSYTTNAVNPTTKTYSYITTERIGIVVPEIVSYYNYVCNQQNILKALIE